MGKRIELKESYVDFRGITFYKSGDGLVYTINKDYLYYKESKYGPSVSVGCDQDARETIEVADIASEVVIEGKTYPVTHTQSCGFMNCKELKTIIFPESMKCIVGSSICAAAEDWQPTNHPLPKLNKLVFNGCRGLENYEYYIKVVHEIEYDSIDTMMNLLTDAPNDIVVKRCPITAHVITIAGKELTDLVIPEGTVILREGFLSNFEGLRSVTLPSSLKVISANAFKGCENLETINFSKGLETIGNYAFNETALREIVIPKGCKLIGSCNFSYCNQLTKVILPEDITEIPNCAFEGTKIESIDLPEGLQTIGNKAFKETPLKEISIPSTVTSIGEYVFDGCGKLAHVYSHIQNPAACDVQRMEEKQYGNYKRLEVFYCQATLHIPNAKGMLTAYKKKAAWKNFSNIVADI